MTLKSARVPPELEPLFERAEQAVGRYFDAMQRDPSTGRIDIFDSRYVMLRGASLSIEFFQLIRRIYGPDSVREADSFAASLLYDLAHAIGKADARNFHEQMELRDPVEKLSAGPVHFAHSGWAFVDIDPASQPSADDDFVLHYTHPFSFEANAWRESGETAQMPVCVMNAGYSAGWCEESFGVQLEAQEVQCLARGDDACRFIMAPPSRLRDRIDEFVEQHPAESCERHSLVHAGLLSGEPLHPEKGVDLSQELATRLLSYARRLEAAQTDLQSKVLALRREVKERKSIERKLQRLASEDDLTGLLSRNAFLARLDQFLDAAERSRGAADRAALLFVDLDKFKEVNDTLGHDIGDQLLKAVSGELRNEVGERDVVARLGGDEFAIWIEGLPASHAAGLIASRILAIFEQPFVLDEHRVMITPSIGIALYPDDGESSGSLLRHADLAMYEAKQRGCNHFQYFAPAMNQRVQDRLIMENELRQALAARAFTVQYQLRFGTADRRPCAMEALVRWHHPERGPISPAQFIPVAEESGMIVELGMQVLEQACSRFRGWLDAGLEPGRLAVNLSPRQFRQQDLAARVAETLQRTGMPGERLEFEITEGAVMDDAEAAIGIMRELNALGVALAIDDFGTGYSSLSYLRQFPVASLKIDRSFIADLDGGDVTAPQLVRSIAQLAHSMGLRVVAEGIETEQQLERVAEADIEEAQGFLLARPLDADDIPARIAGP